MTFDIAELQIHADQQVASPTTSATAAAPARTASRTLVDAGQRRLPQARRRLEGDPRQDAGAIDMDGKALFDLQP